jgi:hypothetical protein
MWRRIVSKHSNARKEALAAIEEFERTRCHGGLSKGDSGLLNRLRSDDYSAELATAWKLIGKFRKSPEDDQLLIGCIFSAWHYALETPAILDEYNRTAEDFRQLRQCAELLRAFFVGDRIQFQGAHTTGEVEQLLQSLSWAIEMFDRGKRDLSTLPQRLGLNRKLVGPSADAQRMRFTAAMSDGLCAVFRQPLHEASWSPC